MAKRPFASFCFSTFKRPDYLHATLNSVLMQTFSDYEVIVSDNDVEQSGKKIVEAFNDPRFKYFPNHENLGMKKSFNMSLERSMGEFIVMIADDDPIYPDMLMTLHGLQNEYPDYGMYLGGCDWFCTSHSLGRLYNFKVGTNSCLSPNHDIDYKKAYVARDFLHELFSFGIFSHYLWSTCIVKRYILEKIGGVPEYGTAFLGDYAYMAAIGADSGCVIINRALGRQTLHDENFGRAQNDQIALAANNFPEYLERKAGHLAGWENLRKTMLRFSALWVVSHLSFLSSYYKNEGRKEKSLRQAEKEIFKIPYLRKYRFKYFLKKHFPAFHDLLVRIKRSLQR